MSQTTTDVTPTAVPPVVREVLTLAEAAEYLRLGESDVLRLIREQRLPGRSVGNEWRFLKAALQDWLRMPDQRTVLQRQFGALKDDPYLEEMLEQIYRDRGRPMLEE